MDIFRLSCDYGFSFFSEKKEVLLELVMIFFILGVIFVSIMKIMFAAEYFFKANYALNTLQKLSDEMLQESPNFGELEEFKNYDIEFKNISFTYDKSSIFKDFSLKLKEGKTYAIVGLSGCGKSTLVRLLNGSYKLNSGEILIGEKPINTYSKKAINNTISFVYQHTKLFKTSIYENIAFAKDNAQYDEVIKALKLANCMEFINEVKVQSSTELSCGQRQRISIARAFLKNAKLLILDEITSSLDSFNEHKIQQSLARLVQGKTTIVVSHRLNSIINADKIIVLDNGKIDAIGKHDELMQSSELYKNLILKSNLANEFEF